MITEKSLVEGRRLWAKRSVEEGDPHHKIRVELLSEEEGQPGFRGMEDDDGDSIQGSWEVRFEVDSPEVVVEFRQGLPPEELARFLHKVLAMVMSSLGEEIVNLGSTKHGPDHAARLSNGEIYLFRYWPELGAEVAADASSADAAEECVPAAS